MWTGNIWTDVQAGFRKGRGTTDQIANICWITEKAKEFQKNIYLCFIDNAKAFDCVDHDKLWKILKEMGLPVKESYLAQNGLELKLPSRSSSPVYVKQRTLTQRKKKWTLRLITPNSKLFPSSGQPPEFLAPAI